MKWRGGGQQGGDVGFLGGPKGEIKSARLHHLKSPEVIFMVIF